MDVIGSFADDGDSAFQKFIDLHKVPAPIIRHFSIIELSFLVERYNRNKVIIKHFD